MDFLLKNGTVYTGGEFAKLDLLISGGKVCFFKSTCSDLSDTTVIDCDNLFICIIHTPEYTQSLKQKLI